ncbi:MAG TPA: hypothetical protein VK602_10720 [Phyllobacterium sp.]|nr:hypothetical protein [Phyllobacterium sp.]
MRDQLIGEVRKKLDAATKNRRDWRPRFIANELLVDHMIPELKGSEEYEFWRYCGYETCRDITTMVINHLTDPVAFDKDEKAPVLPGFEHLQTHYTVKRNMDGGKFGSVEIIGVPIEQLTDDEMIVIAKKLRTASVALGEHANELDRYRRMRGISAA